MKISVSEHPAVISVIISFFSKVINVGIILFFADDVR